MRVDVQDTTTVMDVAIEDVHVGAPDSIPRRSRPRQYLAEHECPERENCVSWIERTETWKHWETMQNLHCPSAYSAAASKKTSIST